MDVADRVRDRRCDLQSTLTNLEVAVSNVSVRYSITGNPWTATNGKTLFTD